MLQEWQKRKHFALVSIFPYDLPTVRKDWVQLFNFFDIPCVYSEYGYSALSPHVKNLRYYRPPVADSMLFHKMGHEDRMKIRRGINVDDDVFLFGFVGPNQFRKDPQRLLIAFAEVRKQTNSAIYLHMDFEGVFNINDITNSLKFSRGDIFAKKQGMRYNRQQMVHVYNAIDCLVNCSWQEGLSYTVLEAMLCGTPVIGTSTTAQTELLTDAGMIVPCRERAYIPLIGSSGPFMYDAQAPLVENITHSMLTMVQNEALRTELAKKGEEKAKQWLTGVSDINALLTDACIVASGKRRKSASTIFPQKKAVLFAQHSSAGDVMMSTQCLKGLKERHSELPLVYMTQEQFQDIVTGNPYIDEVVDWNEEAFKEYAIKYNPHGERILPGGFNSLDVPLHSMYPYFCKVEAGDIFVAQQEPAEEIRLAILSASAPICVVHSTGGQAEYRTYVHFDKVLKNMGLFVIQIGGENDYRVRCADLNLCGQLSWRETAWVIAHANVFVGPDSGPMHLAAALGTNTVGLFGPAPARVTGAKAQHGAKVINLEPNKLEVCRSLTNCWGRIGCAAPCINTISPAKVKEAIKQLIVL
jgi:hypothetical protein